MKKQPISFGSLPDPKDKIILDLCGGTGAWSQPYKEAGYEVINVTLPDYDVRNYAPPENVYGILAAPPCTMFSLARTNAKKPRDLREGMELIKACLEIIWACQYRIESDIQRRSPLKFWALENPDGMLRWFLGKSAFEFNPWEFGDEYKKKTILWGCFKEPLKSHEDVRFAMTNEQLLLNKSNSRILPKFENIKSKDIHSEKFGELKARRAITPAGFAKAFFKANP